MSRAKTLGLVALIWLAFFYFAVALYGRFSSVGTNAWYSEEINATCVVEKRIDQMAMSCMPGNMMDSKPTTTDEGEE